MARMQVTRDRARAPIADHRRRDHWTGSRQAAETTYHPVGTCKMGSDADGRRRRAACACTASQGLRVADASIMPTLTSGNTNAPSIMIGEKAADMVLEDAA